MIDSDECFVEPQHFEPESITDIKLKADDGATPRMIIPQPDMSDDEQTALKEKLIKFFTHPEYCKGAIITFNQGEQLSYSYPKHREFCELLEQWQQENNAPISMLRLACDTFIERQEKKLSKKRTALQRDNTPYYPWNLGPSGYTAENLQAKEKEPSEERTTQCEKCIVQSKAAELTKLCKFLSEIDAYINGDFQARTFQEQ